MPICSITGVMMVLKKICNLSSNLQPSQYPHRHIIVIWVLHIQCTFTTARVLQSCDYLQLSDMATSKQASKQTKSMGKLEGSCKLQLHDIIFNEHGWFTEQLQPELMNWYHKLKTIVMFHFMTALLNNRIARCGW